jgi:hypothetical protein
MPDRDPSHWLHRLSPDEWLAAAATELDHCRDTLSRRAVRPGVTHARRAAGMAWNAVLALRDDPRFGRSYMDHVVALCSDETATDDVRAAAQALRETKAAPPALVTLGKPDLRPLHEAAKIVAFARDRVASLRAGES